MSSAGHPTCAAEGHRWVRVARRDRGGRDERPGYVCERCGAVSETET